MKLIRAAAAAMNRALSGKRALLHASLCVPIAFGLISVWLGTDTNYDFFNYHLYNPYSFLHGRLDVDLAPAGMQSYFNPLMDLFYYGLLMHLPGPLTGFIMGSLHGLNFVLLLGIACKALPGLPPEDRRRVPLLLAAAGCLTANFLSELGNSMGDDTSALLELGALFTIVAGWENLIAWSRRGISLLLLAGVLAGMGVGLKLTNAPYAVALCAGFLVLPLAWAARMRLAGLLGLGMLLGFALLDGFWLADMWHRYGNPLFPQFSAAFPGPLTKSIVVTDASWLPQGVAEHLLWPFIFSFNPHRVGQLYLPQLIWSVLYMLFVWWAVAAWRGRRNGVAGEKDPRQTYILAYVAVGFLLWMHVFSIYRYIVAIELVAPLAAYLLFMRVLPYGKARRVAGWTLSIAIVVGLLGVRSWGHEDWSSPMVQAEVPVLAEPASTTVILVGGAGTVPHGWLPALLPPEIAFVGVHNSFPESLGYIKRLRELARTRGGETYAVVDGHPSSYMDNDMVTGVTGYIAGRNAIARHLGLTRGPRGCAVLRWLVQKTHTHANVQEAATEQGARCVLAARDQDVADAQSLNDASLSAAQRILDHYGFQLDPQACTVYQAHVGAGSYPYQWCKLETLPPRRAGNQAGSKPRKSD